MKNRNFIPYFQRLNLRACGKTWLLVFIAFAVQMSYAQESKKTMTVVLDAGHGGTDAGNLGTGKYKKTEKDVALDVTLKLGDYIEKNMPDVNVIYTRKTDVYLELHERTKIANEAQADLFISIHCNAFSNPAVHGTETFVMGLHKSEDNLRVAENENAVIFKEKDYEKNYEVFDPKSPETMIALIMRQNAYLDQSLQLSAEVQDQFTQRVSRNNRGVKQAGFYVISKTTMPSVLVELGFLTNPKEEKFLLSELGQDYMASAIYRAFREYKENIQGVNSKIVGSTTSNNPENTIVFKVQFLSSKQKIAEQESNFKGLKNVEYYKQKNYYKYTYGSTTDYDKVFKLLKEARNAGWEEAFVVAFKNGERIPTKEAIELVKQKD